MARQQYEKLQKRSYIKRKAFRSAAYRNKDCFCRNRLSFFSKSADYHDTMDQHCFKKRALEKLILNLAEPSLVVMDNALYHNLLAEPIPRTTWNKTKLKEWLASMSVPFTKTALKVELVG